MRQSNDTGIKKNCLMMASHKKAVKPNGFLLIFVMTSDDSGPKISLLCFVLGYLAPWFLRSHINFFTLFRIRIEHKYWICV